MTSIEDEKIIEHESTYMYEYYGIAEWREKCIIMSEQEINSVKKALNAGIETPLTALVRLPFPKFALEYYKNCESAKKYFEDPAFGYKLYFLGDKALETFAFYMRNSHMKKEELKKIMVPRYLTKEAELIFPYNLDDVVFSGLSAEGKIFLIREIKFIYLSQYIDLEEAKKLGLKKARQFEIDVANGSNSNGYEFETKLSSLNMTARYLMIHILGLYGFKRQSVKEIALDLGISYYLLNRMFKELFPCFFLTLGEFKNRLGVIDKPYNLGEYIEYGNRNYKKYDLEVEINRIHSQLSEYEKIVLSSHSNSEVRAYIVYKYIFKDAKKTLEYLVADSCELQRMVEFVDGINPIGGAHL